MAYSLSWYSIQYCFWLKNSLHSQETASISSESGIHWSLPCTPLYWSFWLYRLIEWPLKTQLKYEFWSSVLAVLDQILKKVVYNFEHPIYDMLSLAHRQHPWFQESGGRKQNGFISSLVITRKELLSVPTALSSTGLEFWFHSVEASSQETQQTFQWIGSLLPRHFGFNALKQTS